MSAFLLFFFWLVDSQKYLGCYRDQAGNRDIDGQLILNDFRMTPSWCSSMCGPSQFKYFGLQYGEECWCGNTYGKHGKGSEKECYSKCKGDSKLICGGDNRNSVYEITTEYPVKSAPSGQPLFGLVMMVKDEAHTLPNTLLPLKPFIDRYYILDTGSKDGTQDAIRRTLGTNGEIWEESFVDYGTTRNRVLDLCQQSANPPVFALMLSADETVYNADALREYLEKIRDDTNIEACAVTMDAGARFDSVRITRVTAEWRYVGRVHEYITSKAGRYSTTPRVPHALIRFHETDSERRMERQHLIKNILEDEKSKKPGDTRTAFYLAMEYSIIGNHSASLDEYRRRVSLGGWQEEVYDSLYQIAWQLNYLNYSWAEIQQAFLDAHQYTPARAEPLYWISDHYWNRKEYHLAYIFSLRCFEIPYPTWFQLWVTQEVYDFSCPYMLGKTGLLIGEYEMGARGMAKAYRARPKNWEIYDELVKYKSYLSNAIWNDIFPPSSNPFVQPPINRDGTTPEDEPVRSPQEEQQTEENTEKARTTTAQDLETTNEEKTENQPQKPWEDADIEAHHSQNISWAAMGLNFFILALFIYGVYYFFVNCRK